MHASQIALILTIVTAAAAAPIPQPLSLGTAGKEIGKGLATGGGLAAVVAGLEHFLGGDNTQSSKRDLSADLHKVEGIAKDLAPLAPLAELFIRDPLSLGTAGKEIGKGLATGGGLAAVVAGLEHFLGGDSSQASKRELIELLERDPLSLGAAGKELGKGLATGGGLAALLAGVEHFLGGDSSQQVAQKRELSERDQEELVARALSASALKPIIGSIAGGLASTGLAALLTNEFGNSQASKRDFTEEELFVRAGVAGAVETGIKDVISKGLLGGVGSAVGGFGIGEIIDKLTGQSSSKRDFDEEALFARAGVAGAAETGIKDIISKGLLGGVGSAVGGFGIGEIIDKLTGQNSKRELTEDEQELVARAISSSVGKGLLGTAVGLGASTVVEDGLDELKKIFSRDLLEERAALGSVGKGLLGTAVGLGASTVVEDGLDELKKLFSREEMLDRRGAAGAAAEVVEDTLGTTIGKSILGGLGSALGGFGVNEIVNKLEGKTSRSLNDLD